jgi:hypothetical protein
LTTIHAEANLRVGSDIAPRQPANSEPTPTFQRRPISTWRIDGPHDLFLLLTLEFDLAVRLAVPATVVVHAAAPALAQVLGVTIGLIAAKSTA